MSRNNDAAEAVSTTADRVRDKAAEVTENVRDIGHKVRDAATETYGEARDRAVGYINQGKDTAVGYINQGKETAEEWEKSLETYVQEKPLQAVIIAAGVGLILGLLWKRR